MTFQLILLGLAGFIAGAQNAVAGGGSFLTFPALMFAGLDPRAANIASTIALFPGQATTGWTGRSMAEGAAGLSLRVLFIVSVIGGAIGAVLLLATPVSVFTHLVPWLILFATAVFVWGSFFRKPLAEDAPPPISPRAAVVLQFIIAIYGGYFGGGIGILMVAALTAVGLSVRHASATKNVLAGVVNVAAVVIFLIESQQHWLLILVLGVTAIAGGQMGVLILRHVPEKILRIVVTAIGVALTISMFMRS